MPGFLYDVQRFILVDVSNRATRVNLRKQLCGLHQLIIIPELKVNIYMLVFYILYFIINLRLF